MKLTGHITTLLLSLAILLPVRISAQTEGFVVYGGQSQDSSPATTVASSSKSAACQSVSASLDTSGKFIEEYEIFFRFDKTDIDVEYLSNKENIASIRHYLANSHRVDSITIYSYASPEGRQKHNQWLSQHRAYAAKEILLKHSPDSAVLNSGMIRICPLSENWPGLIREVEKRYHRHDRDRVLRILKNRNISDVWDVLMADIRGVSSGEYICRNFESRHGFQSMAKSYLRLSLCQRLRYRSTHL